MQSGSIEPVRVFRTAAWIWIGYLASLVLMDLFIYANRPMGPVLWYHLFNSIPAFLFLGISYSKWLKNRENPSSDIAAPGMILLITLAPILVNPLLNLHLPPAPLSNLEGMVLRQLPVLFLGLVLIAWHYNLLVMIVYSLGINLLELTMVFAFGFSDQIQQPTFIFIILVRTVCFIVVGIFINQLIRLLRARQDSLKAANIQLAHYASTLETLTISRERNRMSRELHDTVVHTLSGLSVQLETARAYWDVKPDKARELLDRSLDATRLGLQDTRHAIRALRAAPLDDLGLFRAIQEMSQAAAQRGHFDLQVSMPDHDLLLSPDVEQCIYRVAQEAVENVVHHASARNLLLRLAAAGEDIELTVQDDGIGFDPDSRLPAGHFGLAGIQERVQLAGGKLTIHSQPNGGTTIRLAIKGCAG